MIGDIEVACDGGSIQPVLSHRRVVELRGCQSVEQVRVKVADWVAMAATGFGLDWDCDYEGCFADANGYVRGSYDQLFLVWTCPECGTEHSDGPWARPELDGSV